MPIMTKTLADRLNEVVDRDPRSANRISQDADLGRNFIRSIVVERKDPSIGKLETLLKQFEEKDKFYILTGHEMTEDDLKFLRLLSGLSPEARRNAAQLFRSLLATEGA
ncbi:hypothetical protein [Shimia sp.]|uniref:hypothetical protein n=1 Tax=Shimia sp. TaxID=1954381 RepID=UPI003B8CEA78